jgi:hypothetical protein
MSGVQKIATLVVGVALITTLTLPGRQTPQVIGAASKFTTGVLSTAEGTSKGAVG